MHNYTIVIVGSGDNPNPGHEHSVTDGIFKKLVGELQAQGHTIHHATVTHGAHHHLVKDD